MYCAIAFACGLLNGWSFVAPARADEPDKLDAFLTRLGLTDLRLANLERQLRRETAAEKRLATARRVADAYAEELVSAADDSERFAALHGRVERLLAAVPQASTPAVAVVLLQADYQRAESLMIQWLQQPSDKAAHDEAAKILASIRPLLATRQAELAAAADKAAEAIDSLKTDQQRQAAEEQLKRQRALAARADYFSGWAAYYLGVSRQPTGARGDFTTAKEHFSRVLDVTDDKDYEPIEAASLGLDSIWRARAAIGLGMAELGLKQTVRAARIFGWLSDPNVPAAVGDQADYWHLQGMLNAGLLREAGALAAREVTSFMGTPSPGKCSLCVAAIRAGATALAGTKEDRRQLIEQGIAGLARMRQFETLDRLIDDYKLDDETAAAGFQLMWLRGRRQYLAGEKAKQPEAFRAASETLAVALAQPQARTDVTGAGQARYYLAWCRYRLEEWDAAARGFHETATALRSAMPELAVQAAWMHATCLVQLAAKDKRQVSPAIAALQSFKQDFPASEEAQRVDILMTRLRQTHAAPQDAIRELAAIRSSDPAYPSAQYEICQLQYQLWSKVKSDPPKAAPPAAGLLKSVDRFLSLASDRDDERRLKAALLAIDVLQGTSPPDRPRMAALLSKVTKAAERLDPKNGSVVEYQFRRLQLAQGGGDVEAAKAAADWIAEHGRGSAFEPPALVIMARWADQAVASASDTSRVAKVAEAARTYGRLVELLGESVDVLSANKNALAAASKLAQYDEEQGAWDRAADRLTGLVAAAPRDRRLLRRAGTATYNAGRYSQSLEHWRALLAGVESGTEDWFEAKYYQIACLRQADAASAAKTYQQFKVLFPDVKPAVWRQKFAELDNLLQ